MSIRKRRLRSKGHNQRREVYFIMIEGSIHQEDLTILNVYAHHNRDPKYMTPKQIQLQGQIQSTIIVGEFNIPLSIIYRTSTQRIYKDKQDLNNTINRLHIIDIHRTLHPTTANAHYFQVYIEYLPR